MASLLEQVVSENVASGERGHVDATGERYGCGASDKREKRACSLYLWLLGPTTKQLATICPCQR
ncbi:MAG: hypothetical protein KC481_15020 [Acidimicrobiaceae bacterium]|nr:hypothetical protein [Acidimicrobiaceae bacterium]MCO4834974.1 hypothetical protein [Acidimicrobiaceae bacterium]MDG1087933.1 hypothetical protein [Acidimicrobiales bacterium]